MKKILNLLTVMLLATIGLTAQTAPEGMRFQAIARGLDGTLLTRQTLTIQVELMSAGIQEEIFYTEVHKIRSSDLGLLDFVIGEGVQKLGRFAEIPWTKYEMWVRISVKTPKDKHYQIISSGQLYSVPYAQYATTAGELKDGSMRIPGLGMSSINWTLEGNYNSQERNNGNPVLGTTDANDLVIVTNNIPRIIIDADGHIEFMLDMDINGTLNVDGTATLNGALTVTNMAATHLTGTLTVDNSTTLNDDLTVENEAPSHFTGDLDTDGAMNIDGATTLNSSLTVTGQSATSLSGKLDVDQSTTLHDDLTVANAAPAHLTGNLDVDGEVNIGGDITLNGPIVVDNMHPTNLSGTLEVDGLTTFESGIVVKGGGTLGPDGTHLAYFENEEGGSSDGIAVKLATDNPDKHDNFMTFYRGTSVAGRIEGYQVGDMDDIPAPTSDEIWTAICIAVADYNPVSLVWTSMANNFNIVAAAWNATTIPAFDIADIPAFTIPDVPALTIPDVPAFVIPDVPSFVIPDVPGFVIPDVPQVTIGPYLCVDEEVCFCLCDDLTWDCCCVNVEFCLIPEMTLFPGITLPDFPGIPIPDFPGIPIPDFPGIVVTDFPGIAIPDFPGLEIPPVPEIDLSGIFGTCPTMPTFSDLLQAEGVCPDEDIFNMTDGYFARLAKWAFEHRLHNLVGLDPVKLLGNALAWGLTTAVLNDGVVYGSKGADYAEYLEKQYTSEVFLKGEVVGVYNGKISKNTANADQILAITSQPMVLGNMQEENMEDYEKVAFLGQIPVYVKGRVAEGDFLIPSGNNDGFAIALPEGQMTADKLSMVLGKAWSAHEGEGVSMVNASIGLRPNEIAEVLKKQVAVEIDLQRQMLRQKENSDILSSDIELMKQKLGLSTNVYNP